MYWFNNKSLSWYFSCSGPVAPDRDVYFELAKDLFGEERLSTHPVPEYMEAGEVPRYVTDGCFPNLKKSWKARLEVFFSILKNLLEQLSIDHQKKTKNTEEFVRIETGIRV